MKIIYYFKLPKLFSQSELNELVQNLDVAKRSSELQACMPKEWSLLLPGTTCSFIRIRDNTKLLQYFENFILAIKDILSQPP